MSDNDLDKVAKPGAAEMALRIRGVAVGCVAVGCVLAGSAPLGEREGALIRPVVSKQKRPARYMLAFYVGGPSETVT